jgi:hypothetical protein
MRQAQNKSGKNRDRRAIKVAAIVGKRTINVAEIVTGARDQSGSNRWQAHN